MTGRYLTPRERRDSDQQRGARSAASLLARFEREIDPDGQLPPEERTRLAEEARREHYRQAGQKGRTAQLARKARIVPAAEVARVAPAESPPKVPNAARQAGAQRSPDAVIDPAWWDRPDMRAALADHDIQTVYRALHKAGISQRQIAALTGQSQSEVADIAKGRKVNTYEVLARIATGLAIPREYMGLSSYGAEGAHCAYPDGVTVADPVEEDEMLRRHFQHLLALAAAAAFGGPVNGVGELSDWLTAPGFLADTPRIGAADVAMIRQCGEQVGTLARTCGGQGRASVRLAAWADEWLDATCTDMVRCQLLSTLAHIHTVTAWCCHDTGSVARSHWHFGRAVELATEAGDSYQVAYALRHAGMMLVDRNQPNDALKMIQLGGLRVGSASPSDPRVPVQRAECHVVSALALSKLYQLDPSGSAQRQALDELRAARDEWTPPTAHAQGCMDLDSAHAYLHIGRHDVAEALAHQSARTFTESGDRREGVLAGMALARLHVQAGESRSLALAHSAIEEVAGTRSAVARQCWLPPLAQALEARPGSEANELARMARQVATAA